MANCEHCNDTGWIIIRATTGSYVGGGILPDDARGVCNSPCYECPDECPDKDPSIAHIANLTRVPGDQHTMLDVE